MTNQPEESLKRFGWWLLASFLVTLGAQLWVVWLYGSPVPIWDQWGEATTIFKPWLEGHLTPGVLLTPDSNHRMVVTYLLDISLIHLNGRWEPMLQMTFNVFIPSIFAAGLAYCLWNFSGRRNGWLICILLVPFFALPYGGENSTWGLNSLWFLVSPFALVTILGLGFAKPASWRWWLGIGAAILGIFTIASGILAPLAAGGLVFLRALKHRRLDKEIMIGLGTCVFLTVAGIPMIALIDPNRPLQAHSFGEFTNKLSEFLAWPFPETTIMACVISLPLVFLLVAYLRPNFEEARYAELLLALGLWSALQSLAIAFGRANSGLYLPFASRYMDVCNMFVIAAVFAAFLLGVLWRRRHRQAWLGTWLPVIFTAVIFFGLCRISERVVQDILVVTREWNLIAEERVQTYMASGNPKDLFNAPTVQPDPRMTMKTLDDSTVQTILPSACFPPAKAPQPGALYVLAQWLMAQCRVILFTGLILSISLLGCSLAREPDRWKMPLKFVGLLVVLTSLWLAWSNRTLTRRAVECDLQQQIADYFNGEHRPDRAAIHEQKAEALRKQQ
jgi:hypothetical protein